VVILEENNNFIFHLFIYIAADRRNDRQHLKIKLPTLISIAHARADAKLVDADVSRYETFPLAIGRYLHFVFLILVITETSKKNGDNA